MSVPLIVFEDFAWQRFLPLVYVRGVFELVTGFDSLFAKIRRNCLPSDQAGDITKRKLGVWCRKSIADVVAERMELPVNCNPAGQALLLNGRVQWLRLPELEMNGQAWVGLAKDQQVACIYAPPELLRLLDPAVLLDEGRTRAYLSNLPRRDVSHWIDQVYEWPWELVHANERNLLEDWESLTSCCTSNRLCGPNGNGRSGRAAHLPYELMQGSHLINENLIRIGTGTRIKPCVVIDAEAGPVWIGEHCTIQPHSYIQGPAYIGDRTLVQPGTVIREGTTIGPVCKVGGEIESSIIHGYSNKQHDGFLGHSYIGSWVNIAADCISSDLKNTYGTIRVPINGREVETGHKFVGMLIGDHSKAGINVGFPTGCVIGFCSSVISSRSPKFVSSFCWIDGEKIERYDEKRGLTLAKTVMARRAQRMSPAEESAFLTVREQALAIEQRQPVIAGRPRIATNYFHKSAVTDSALQPIGKIK